MADVEKLATSKIEALVAMCPHLQSIIDSNDKTPLTDGHIDVYSGLGRSNKELQDRMPVQVKGRSTPKERRFTPVFRMNRDDLEAHRRQGSVLLFVVFVSPLGKCDPYYYVLSPFKIDLILSELPATRSSTSLSLIKLPEKPEEIESIVALALVTKKQRYASFNGVGLEGVTSFTVRSTAELDLSSPQLISPMTGDYALEVQTTDGSVLALPGELMVYPASYMERPTDLVVSAGGSVFEALTVRQIDAEHHELKLSETLVLTMRFGNGLQGAHVSLTLAETVAERAREIDFFLGLVDNKTMLFNDVPHDFETPDFGELDELRQHRRYLGQLIELLDVLEADTSLVTFNEITDEQHKQLNFIHGSLVQGRELHADNGAVGRVLESVGRWKIMLLVFPGSKPNMWRYVDPFHPENRFQFKLYRVEDGGPVEWPATAYDAVEPSDLPSILNLHLEHIVGAYEIIAELPETSSLANWEVLHLLQAADAVAPRRAELLKAAEELNDWILKSEPKSEVHLVNRWQIIARSQSLTDDHRQQIRQVRRDAIAANGSRARQIEASCCLLLGDREELDICLSLLSDEELKQLQSWPIWSLGPSNDDVP